MNCDTVSQGRGCPQHIPASVELTFPVWLWLLHFDVSGIPETSKFALAFASSGLFLLTSDL
jgi:hypothetical protein